MKRGSPSSTTTTATNSSNKFSRIMKAPFRALCRARDFYVNSLTGCAGRVNYRGGVVGYAGGGASSGMPRSFSFHPSRASSSSEDDIRDLMRAASQGAMGSLNRNHPKGGGDQVVPRSQSVGIGRIDEDQPCDFGGGDDAAAVGVGPLYPRSRSCAVVAKRRVGVVA